VDRKTRSPSVADTTPATRAAQQATSTIPIVMAIVADPVGDRLVAKLSQPGGNVTGLSIMLAELSAKRLQLAKEAMPTLTRVVALWNPPTPYHAKAVENLKAVAPSLAIELNVVSARTPEEIDPAFEAVNRAHAQALYVIDSPPFFTHRTTLLRLAAKARLAVISGEAPYAHEGGLMSFSLEFCKFDRVPLGPPQQRSWPFSRTRCATPTQSRVGFSVVEGESPTYQADTPL
jgi:putative ABC transport system substrate-binding protein